MTEVVPVQVDLPQLQSIPLGVVLPATPPRLDAVGEAPQRVPGRLNVRQVFAALGTEDARGTPCVTVAPPANGLVEHIRFGTIAYLSSSKTAFTLPLRTARSSAAWSFSFWSA